MSQSHPPSAAAIQVAKLKQLYQATLAKIDSAERLHKEGRLPEARQEIDRLKASLATLGSQLDQALDTWAQEMN